MTKSASKTFTGAALLLLTSYIIYFVRYPIWSWTIEPIFAMLILSYSAVFILALLLIKLDLKKSLRAFFRFQGSRLILVSLFLAGLFQVLWYSITLALGASIRFITFPSLRGYELYSYYFLPLAFAVYLIFSVFGAFAEEVAYRGYIQSRIQATYGVFAGIVVSAVFFALQHIHVFQLPWIENFFEGQFFIALIGGLFMGYLYYRTKGDIWSVFTFHAVGNILSVALPLEVTYAFPYAGWISTAIAYAATFTVLHILPLKLNQPLKPVKDKAQLF
ncbi:MAG: lysostaphin resistance A-like protein [Candidatus Bathyarchaeia archaeon]|jgi:membrane protease YdiL (CAAX protease family)